MAACGEGVTRIVVKEHCYDLVLARYAIRIGADTSNATADDEPVNEDAAGSGSLSGLLGTDLVVSDRGTGDDADDDPDYPTVVAVAGRSSPSAGDDPEKRRRARRSVSGRRGHRL